MRPPPNHNFEEKMKIKVWLFVALAAAGLASGAWLYSRHKPSQTAVASAASRSALYYTCAMHPWVRESKPGPCPVCGMNLTPVYGKENHRGRNQCGRDHGHPRTGKHQRDQRANRFGGTPSIAPDAASCGRNLVEFSDGGVVSSSPLINVIWNGSKLGQTFEVSVASAPDRIYKAQIKAHSAKPFADEGFDMMTSSTKVRAEISIRPSRRATLANTNYSTGFTPRRISLGKRTIC